MTVVRYTIPEVEAFARASHDFNPLHLSSAYARKTPWGECVVFGLLGALRCLSLLRERATDELSSLSVEFPGAMFVDTDYDFRVLVDEAGLARAKLHDGRRVLLKLTARFRPRTQSLTEVALEEPPEIRQACADHGDAELTPGLTVGGVYTAELAQLQLPGGPLGLERRGVPAWQVAILMAQSYIVGMELPGRRALFSAAAVEFAAPRARLGARLRFGARLDGLDARFGLASITVDLGDGDGLVARAKLSALVRSVIHAPSAARIVEALPCSTRLAGRVALVIGASRGLGAAITQALLSQGCTVLASYNHSDAEMAELVADATQLPGALVACKGDAGTVSFCDELRRQITSGLGRLDFLVCSASPPLRSFAIESITAARMNAFVANSVALTMLPVAHLLALVEEARGAVAAISSSFVDELPTGWSHYIAAKSAIEGWFRAVAAETPTASFFVYRPPRLLTDFSNSPFGNDQAMSPDKVAIRLVRDLMEPKPAAGHVMIVDRFA
jgi:NAD(P)-dependent dehydrogenase (short-subunit alcohol dehydrogenase family)